MSIMSRAADLIYAYRFIKLLTTSWENTEAYKLGIIDGDGNVLKPVRQLETSKEKSAYTVFHRLVFNIKRLLDKIPGGGSKLGSYAAALYLIKEETGLNDEEIVKIMEKAGVELGSSDLKEAWYINESNELMPGKFSLLENILIPLNGEMYAKRGSVVSVPDFTSPVGSVMGCPVYAVEHCATKATIFITASQIRR